MFRFTFLSWTFYRILPIETVFGEGKLLIAFNSGLLGFLIEMSVACFQTVGEYWINRRVLGKCY